MGESRGHPGFSPPCPAVPRAQPPLAIGESTRLRRRWHLQEKGHHGTSPVIEWFSRGEIQPTTKQPLPPALPKMDAGAFGWLPASLLHLEPTCWLALTSFLDHVLSKASSSPFPRTSPWYLCAVFCCIFIFISFPVYKMAVIGAANQGCLDAKHAAARRWALCDAGTAMLIFFRFFPRKDHFSAKPNYDFLQQRRELLLQKKKTPKNPTKPGHISAVYYCLLEYSLHLLYHMFALPHFRLCCFAKLHV